MRYTKTKLEVTQGPDAGLSLEVAGAAVHIGTSPENDLVLTDETVSQRHCEVLPSAKGLHVRDQGSTNGVVVGGARINDATFVGPATLELGQTTIAVTPLSETVDREQLDDDGPPRRGERPTSEGHEPFLPLRAARRKTDEEFEKDYLRALLARAEGNVTRAAAMAQVSRQLIHKLLAKHGI